MKSIRAAAVLVISTLSVVSTAETAGAQSAPAPTWAPAAEAAIHPGVQTVTESGQCTSNFVFFDSTDVYLGQAAHCSGTGLPNQINGCETGVLPIGAPVQIEGATQPGRIVYNSWVTMQQHSEQNENTCYGNDFALVRIDPADRARVNPSVPFWGGPNGIDSGSGFGDSVYAYGKSQLRLGVSALSPQFGFSTGQDGDGWSHVVYMITPGVPGDSGSAYLGPDGGALGTLSTISVLLSNQVSDLGRVLHYMRVHSDLDYVQLANGTEPFSPLL